MRKNLYITLSFLLIGFLCIRTECKKDIEYKYHFIEKVDLFPVQKIYKVGDTLWIQYSNPNKKLFDNSTKQYILSDTLSIPFQIGYNFRYGHYANPVGGFCDYVDANGIVLDRYLSEYGTSTRQNFGCNTSNSYNFKIGIVPKLVGIYSLDFFGTEEVVPCSRRISNFMISTIEYRFNITDGNKDIYLSFPPSSPGELPKGYTEGRIDNKQAFVFKVE